MKSRTLSCTLIGGRRSGTKEGRRPDRHYSGGPRRECPEVAGDGGPTRWAAVTRAVNLVLPGLVHPDQAVLGMKLLALHARQGLVVQRQDAELGVEDLFVEFTMTLEQLAELRVSFHHRVDLLLWLSFKHRLTSF